MPQQLSSASYSQPLLIQNQADESSIDHPDRMLFYAGLFGLLLWSVIGLLAWGVWKLLT